MQFWTRSWQVAFLIRGLQCQAVAVAGTDIDTEGDGVEDVVEVVVGANEDDCWNGKGIEMKIAVTSKSEGVDSSVDSRFGRAKGFVVANLESGEVVFSDNEQSLNAVQGAGIQVCGNEAVDV